MNHIVWTERKIMVLKPANKYQIIQYYHNLEETLLLTISTTISSLYWVRVLQTFWQIARTTQLAIQIICLLFAVSHQLTVYLSIFNLYISTQLRVKTLWPFYQKYINQLILNRTTLYSLALWIFEAFVQILLIVNLFWIKLSWHFCFT